MPQNENYRIENDIPEIIHGPGIPVRDTNKGCLDVA